MRMHPSKMKMLIFMKWFVSSHKSLLTLEEKEKEIDDNSDPNYQKLYQCCKDYLSKNPNLENYQNYYSIAQKLNLQIDRMKRSLSGSIEETGCVLMILIVGILRHCDFDKLQGFDDLKSIDLDAIIARAREEKYLNTWSVQSLCRGFKYGYWEA